MLGPLWAPCPRFVTPTDRPIDDASYFGQNATVTVPWKLVFGGVDEATALAVTMVKSVDDQRWVRIFIPGVGVLEGKLADDWLPEEVLKLFGRLADMKGAYRQLAGYPGHRFASVVAILNGEGQVAYFIPLALLFGQTAAVYGFNRVSKLLSVVASRLADLINSPFYDDF